MNAKDTVEFVHTNGRRFKKFRCFRAEDGQKSERWYNWPVEAYQWFSDNVTLVRAGGHGKAHIFGYPSDTTLSRREGRHDDVCERMRALFRHLYVGLKGQLGSRIPFRREEVLGMANHLHLTPLLTGSNVNPNRDNRVNPKRLTQRVYAVGADL